VLVFCDTRDSAVFLDCWTRLFRTSKVIAFSHTIGSFCHEKLVDADRVESQVVNSSASARGAVASQYATREYVTRIRSGSQNRHPDPYLKSSPLAPSHHFRRSPSDPENGPAHVPKQTDGQRPTEMLGPAPERSSRWREARHSLRPSARLPNSPYLGQRSRRRRSSPPPSPLPPMARLHWLEAMLPLGIIGGMLCIMGNAQYYIHRAAHGRVRSDPTLPDPDPPRADSRFPPRFCVGAAEAHRERHVGRRHGAPRQEARRAAFRQLGADLAPCPCSSCVGLFLVFGLRRCVAARNDSGS
jgi:hypothetical protein